MQVISLEVLLFSWKLTTQKFYTGDIKTIDTYLQKGATVPKADILITDGNRTHPNRKELEKEFVDIIDETISRGGIAVVPAFAVGRTQEVLIMLGNINHPVYLDGMGQDITRLFLQFPDHLKDAELLRESANKVEWISNSSERKRVLYQPCVIVTTAGMINGGPIINYIQRLRSDPKSSIILTGYQVEGTNGRLLMEKG